MEPAKTPKQRQSEEQAEHEQEQEEMKGHQNPRCLKGVAGIVCFS
jgi:hypothetical protein